MRRLTVLLVLVETLAACTASVGNTASSTSTLRATTTSTTTTPTVTTTPGPTVGPADIVFINGIVHTQDPDFGTVEAVAVTDDVITAVGSNQEIQQYAGDNTVAVDLGGRTLIPGFVDAHTHILTDTGSVAVGQPMALEAGITTVGEAFINQERLDTLVASARSGELKLRTHLYLVRTDNCGNDQGTWYEAYQPGAMLADRVRVAGVKIFADGGSCGLLASSQPFKEAVPIGEPFTSQDVMEGYIRDADAAGYQILVHAIGDLAIAQVLDAFEAVLGPGGAAKLRHRIDHNTFQPPQLAGRYDEVGVSAALFGWRPTCSITPDAGYTDFWYDYVDDPSLPIATNPNTVFGWHGDDPWIGPVSPLLEMLGMSAAAEYVDGTICWPDERWANKVVPRATVFDMMTLGSSYLLEQEGSVGSLTPGKYADMVILSDDLLAVETADLVNIRVEMTMIGGVAEYCADPVCQPLSEPASQGPPGGGACIAPPEGLVGWWPADTDATNVETGDAAEMIDGTVIAPGAVDNAFRLSASAVSLSGQPSLSGGFTVEGWVRFDDPATGFQTVFNNNQMFLRKNGDEEGGGLAVFVKLADGSVEPRAQTLNGVEPDRWYHVAATWDGHALILYLDGAQQESVDRTGELTPTTVEARIGAGEQESVSGNEMRGYVDELTFYDRALGATEIEALASAGSDGKCK